MSDVDWEQIRRTSRSDERPNDWPADVRGISMNGAALLGVDDQNRLYWDGKRVPTVTLTFWQKAGALTVAASAVVGAASAALSAYADIVMLG